MRSSLRFGGPLHTPAVILAVLVGCVCFLSLFSSVFIERLPTTPQEQLQRRRLIRSAAKAADAAISAVQALKSTDESVQRDGPRRAAEAVLEAWREAVPLLHRADQNKSPIFPQAPPTLDDPQPQFAPAALAALPKSGLSERAASPPQPPAPPPVVADPLAPPADVYVPLRSPFPRAPIVEVAPHSAADAASADTADGRYWPLEGLSGPRGENGSPLRRGQLAAEPFYAPRGVDGASDHTCARLGRLDFAPPRFTDESTSAPMQGLDGVNGQPHANAGASATYRRLEFGRWAMAWPRFIRREHRTWFENYAIVRWRRAA